MSRPQLLSLIVGITAIFSWGKVCAGVIVPDPVGDTIGSGSVVYDITSVSLDVVGPSLNVAITFHGPILAPSASPDGVVGYLFLDVDQNPATGQGVFPPQFGPAYSGLGSEFYIDLFSELFTPGMVDVIDTGTNFPSAGSPAIATYAANVLTLNIPLAALGGDDGSVHFGLTAGTLPEPVDVVQFPPTATATVPEPATWLLLLGGLALGCRRRHGRFSQT